MEPESTTQRLGDVRPDPRPSADHAGHDRWLVVRWTSDPADLSRTETAQARSLLAGCPECAALAADLELITLATVTSVVPTRPRDFRITPEQAANARGGMLDRVRRWLGSPRSVVLRPLAGAAVAMGLVLVLVAPNVQPTAPAGGDPEAVDGPPATSVLKATPVAPNVAGAAEMFTTATDDPAGAEADTQLRMAGSPTPANDTTSQRESATDAPGPVVADAPVEGDGSRAAGAAMDDTTYALTLLGIVLAGVGLLVLLLSWLARRWQDPLLR